MAGEREAIASALEHGSPDKALQLAAAYIASPAGEPPNAKAVEVAKEAAAAYRSFMDGPVEDFARKAPEVLGAEHGGLVQRALQRLFALSQTWDEKVVEVHRERIARELRDLTRARRTAEAQQHIREMLDFAEDDEKRAQQAKYIGAVLGTVLNQQQEAKDLIGWMVREAAKLRLAHHSMEQAVAAYQQRSAAMMSVRPEAVEIEWTRRLAAVETDMRAGMPEKNKMGEPDEATLRDVGDVFRSVARVPLRRDQRYFPDIVTLFEDFAPGAISDTAKAAGVETRSYSVLGFMAKKAVLLTYQDIGRKDRFVQAYLAWLQKAMGTDMAHKGIAVGGLLRTEKLAPILVKCYREKGHEEARPAIAEALGDIGSPEAVEVLRLDLREAARHADRDPEAQRHAMRLLTALGKIVRSPRTSAEVRGSLAHFATEVIPHANTRLALRAAREVVSYKAEELRSSDRQWAVRALVAALWMDDESASFAKGGERELSLLGFRHPIAEALKSLSGTELPAIIAELEKFSMRYGAAYMAAAEVLEKTGSPEALPVLERMLMNSLRGDDGGNKYQKEYYWDSAQQTRVELSRDKVVSPIVYAIGKIGGEDAKRILVGVQQQVQAGRITLPGEETARFLQQFAGMVAGPAGRSQTEAALPHAEPAEVAQLVKAITGSYLLTGAEKRRIAKITALSRLGQLTPPAALEAVVEQLGDKDTMVAAAAVTTIGMYAAMDRPVSLQTATVQALLRTTKSKDPAVRIGIGKALKEIGLGRPDVRAAAEAWMRDTPDHDSRRLLQDLLRGVGGGSSPAVVLPGSGLATPDAPAAPGAAVPGGRSALDAKREYMEARRAWIAGGKKGPPPEPPA